MANPDSYNKTVDQLRNLLITDFVTDAIQPLLPASNGGTADTTSSLNYNGATGVLTYVNNQGTQTSIDLPIENLFQNAAYNSNTKTLNLTTNGGGTIAVPLTDLVDIAEVVLATVDPDVTPSTGQKVYFRTDTGKYWLNVSDSWVGGFLPLTQAEKDKLAGIAPNATANATNTELRDRATHTGTQSVTTITGLGSAATQNASAFQAANARLNTLATQTNPASPKVPQLNTDGSISFVDVTSGSIPSNVATLDNDGKVFATQSRGSSLTYNASTGILNFIDASSTAYQVDLPVENLFQSAAYNSATKTLNLTTNGGGTIAVPLSDLVDLPEIVLSANADPSTTPTTGQKIYFRSDSGKYWLSSGTTWLGGFLAMTQAERDKLAGIATGATANLTSDSLSEGLNNLYYTVERAIAAAKSAITAGDNVTINNGVVSASLLSWIAQIDDTGDRANSATVGNGWVEPVRTGVSSIVSNRFRVTRNTANQSVTLQNDFLARPSSEAKLDQEIEAYFIGGSGYGHHILRFQNGSNYYTFVVPFAGQLGFSILKQVAEVFTTVSTGNLSTAIVSGRTYKVSFRAKGTNPTVLTGAIEDTTTGGAIGTLTGSDSTAALQNAGVAAFASDGPFQEWDRLIVRTFASNSGTISNTDSLPEGTTNFYATNSRIRNAISATGTGAVYDPATGVFTFTAGTGGGGGSAGIPGALNVQDYGASASASASVNKTAFQNCATAAAAGSKAMFVPPVSTFYAIDGTINIPDNVTVFGLGWGSWIKITSNVNGTTEQPDLFKLNGTVGNVEIRDLHFQGTGTSVTGAVTVYGDSNTSHAIACNSNTIKNVVIRNCFVHDFVLGAFNMNLASDVRILNNFCWNNTNVAPSNIECNIGTLSGADAGYRFQIIGNYFLSNGDQGINFDSARLDQGIITNNVIIAMTRAGVPYVEGATENSRRRHCIMAVYSAGSDAGFQKRVIIANNIFGHSSWTGININTAPGNGTFHRTGSFVIDSNIFFGIGQQTVASAAPSGGIRGCVYCAGGGETFSISNNHFCDSANNVAAVNVPSTGVSSWSNNLLINGNTLENMQLGVHLSQNARNIAINNNYFSKTVGNDIGWQGANTSADIQIYNNRFQRNNANNPCINWISGADESSLIDIKGNWFIGANTTTDSPNNSAIFVRGARALIFGNHFKNFFHGVYFNTINISRGVYPVVNHNSFENIAATGYAIRASSSNGSKIPVEGNIFNGVTQPFDSGVALGRRIGQNVELWLSAVPTSGTYIAGDSVIISAPAAGVSWGSRCTTGGSPGTFKSMGTLAP